MGVYRGAHPDNRRLLGHKKEPSAETSHAKVSTRTLCLVRKARYRRTKDGVSVSLMPTLVNIRQIQRWAVGQRSSGRGKEGALVQLTTQRLSCVVNVTNGKVLTQEADAGELLRV